MLDVGSDLVFGDPANGGTEVATRPDGLAPVAFFEMREFLLQASRRTAFEILHHLGWTQARRTTDQHMDMVFTDMTFQDVNVAAHADLPDDVPRSLGHFALQDGIAIFRHPDQVILDVVHRVRPCAVVLQAALPCPILPHLAKAFRLKAKVLDLALGK